MSELPGRDYTEVHRLRLSGLLDASQEIAWSQTPNVYLETIGEELIHSRISGLGGLPEVERDFEENTDTELGMMTLMGFKARAAIMLMNDLRDRDGNDSWPSENQNRRTAWAFERTSQVMEQAEGQYTFMSFQNTENPESVGVYFLKLQGAEDEFDGRELKIVRKDGLLAYTFTVTEAGWSDSVAPPMLKVRQEVSPHNDDEFNAMADFFINQHDDADSYTELIVGFVQYLQDSEPDFSKVLSQYEGSEKDQVQGFIALLRRRAAHARAASQLLREHPGLGLPTEQDMEAYGAILAQIRGS